MDYLSQSISRMIMITFIVALLLPLAFLLPSLDKNIWKDVHKDNLVKHQLLATSLVEPISMHLANYENALQSLARSLMENGLKDKDKSAPLLDKFINNTQDMIAVSLLSSDDPSLTISIKKSIEASDGKNIKADSLNYIVAENKYRRYDMDDSISPVFKSEISGKPVILIKHQILDQHAEKRGTLFAELGLGFLHKICSQIAFGNNGHCAIVDNAGKVLAHPNAEWVSQMQSLSQDQIIKKIQTGKGDAGALEYYSSANNVEMIGGYSRVAKLGWGVMVLQPAVEIYLPFDNIKTAMISWVVIGVLTSLFFAFFVTRKITRPLNTLVTKAKQLDVQSESFRLGEVPNRSPIEIRVLWNTISSLIVNFQQANAEVNSLSGSMSKDLRSVVAELRANNLSKVSNKDPLTGITSRECFETELSKALTIHKGEEVGVILIDVDILGSTTLAKKGNEFVEFVIKHVANILADNIRDADMAARYDDGNKFAVYINNSTPKSLQGTAEKLRALVEMDPLIWEQETHYISLSIGIVSQKIDKNLSYVSLMAVAEKTLEKSQSNGNNHISSHHLKSDSAYSSASTVA